MKTSLIQLDMSKKCYYKVWDKRLMNFWPPLFTDKYTAMRYVDNELHLSRKCVRIVNFNEKGLFEKDSPYLRFMYYDCLRSGGIVYPIGDSKTA